MGAIIWSKGEGRWPKAVQNNVSTFEYWGRISAATLGENMHWDPQGNQNPLCQLQHGPIKGRLMPDGKIWIILNYSCLHASNEGILGQGVVISVNTGIDAMK